MITDTETTQEDQIAFNTRLQSQDTMDAKMTGMDVKLELLCNPVADLTQMVKGKAPVVATSSTKPDHRPKRHNIDPTTDNIVLGIQGDANLIPNPRPLAGSLIKNISVEFSKFSGEDPRG